MGWFDRARSFISSASTKTGGVLRKIGDIGQPVLRKIGDISGNRLVKTGVMALGAGLAPFTGGASLGIAGGVLKGMDVVNKIANKGADIAGKVSQIGRVMGDVGQTISGKPQTPQIYNAAGIAPAGMGGSMLPMRGRN